MANYLITGARNNTPHVTSMDDASFNAGIVGNGTFILNRGEKLRAEVITNNLVRLMDGDLVAQGRHIRIETSTYVDLTIDNGTPDMKRNDLICAHYEKDISTGIESVDFVVIKGEESASDPVDPAYTVGDIFAGDLVAEFPIYRIPIDGLTVNTPVFLADKISAASDIVDYVIEAGKSNNWDYRKWASGRMTATLEVYWSSIPMTDATSGGSYAIKRTLTLPNGLVSRPKVWANCTVSTGYVVCQVANLGIHTYDLRIAKLFAGGNLDETHIALELDGQWK